MRLAKTALVLMTALQGWILALSNTFSFQGVVVREVTRTLSMEATWQVPEHMWRATDSPFMIYAASFLIVGLEFAMAVLCTLGALQMWRARGGDAASFDSAKMLSLLGFFCGVVLFYGVFTVVGGNFYEMWQGAPRAVLDTAFRHGTFILLIMLFVAEKNQD
jgi:predicted small integral membrane protein